MWVTIGLSAGPVGLMGLSGLADPNDAEAQEQLEEVGLTPDGIAAAGKQLVSFGVSAARESA